MKKFLEQISFFFNIALGGIFLWVRPPLRLKLRVDNDWERRRQEENEKVFGKYYKSPSSSLNKIFPAHPVPPMKMIHMQFWRSDYKCWADCGIAINLEKKQIEYSYSSSWLFGKEYDESALGVMVASLPITLPLSPIIILVGRYYRMMEKRRGLSRYSHAILKALKGQLDAETETLLITALKKEWQKDEYIARHISLKEAKQLLYQCHLYESRGTEDWSDEESYGWQQCTWFDENGICVGFMQVRNECLDNCWVLGSHFEYEEAKLLPAYFKTRELVYHYDEKNKESEQ